MWKERQPQYRRTVARASSCTPFLAHLTCCSESPRKGSWVRVAILFVREEHIALEYTCTCVWTRESYCTTPCDPAPGTGYGQLTPFSAHRHQHPTYIYPPIPPPPRPSAARSAWPEEPKGQVKGAGVTEGEMGVPTRDTSSSQIT